MAGQKKNNIPMIVGVIFLLSFTAALVVLAYQGGEPPKSMAKAALAASTLRSLATAAETYRTVVGIYPAKVQDLLTAQPPYLNQDICALRSNGYAYGCHFSKEGYIFTALPTAAQKDRYFKTFSIKTGAVLSER